jgi:thiosulfate/3-mercaptopyruvate sulfurtransferase
MPAPQDLSERLKALGVGDDTHVVLYSRGNMQWATRVWWMLYAIGFDNASVLDGGYDKWSQEGREVSSQETTFASSATLTVNSRPHAFVGKDEVQSAIGDPSVCTINALSAELHRGESERYGRPGRIPGSVNLPATSLQSAADKSFPTPDDAQAAFDDIGLQRNQRSIVYCGGGIAATLDAFLMLQLGYENVGVYDASMSEWARDPELAVETG